MPEKEGVTKYHLQFHRCELNSDLQHFIDDLNQSRTPLLRHDMIGQNKARYCGLGFGNMSVRLCQDEPSFLVSGTQTGYLASLLLSDCSVVNAIYPGENRLKASGGTEPSSESLTHGVIYQSLPWAFAVVHVHCPDIWQHATEANLPVTPATIPYGTPEMAVAVTELCHSVFIADSAHILVFAMQGHQDGVMACASTLQEATTALLHLQEYFSTR